MIEHRESLPPNARKLIEKFAPVYDVSEYHETVVHAPIQAVYDALRSTDFGDSRLIRTLLRLRQLPATLRKPRQPRMILNLDAILKSGFVLLGENAPDEIALGVIGQFWKLSGGRYCVDAAGFDAFDQPGYTRAVWNFSLVDLGGNVTRLATETRVVCSDSASRIRFRLYWTLIGPFSGLIRREVLRTIRAKVEFRL
ncbi:MAG TPA: hypothetical protein VN743_04335 [Blastocatellia bacterium]|nr:hypothetical protein [Blastocatellia bacterium]